MPPIHLHRYNITKHSLGAASRQQVWHLRTSIVAWHPSPWMQAQTHLPRQLGDTPQRAAHKPARAQAPCTLRASSTRAFSLAAASSPMSSSTRAVAVRSADCSVACFASPSCTQAHTGRSAVHRSAGPWSSAVMHNTC
eukprot:355645-Chlamydomonas_euryale.AAC.44